MVSCRPRLSSSRSSLTQWCRKSWPSWSANQRPQSMPTTSAATSIGMALNHQQAQRWLKASSVFLLPGRALDASHRANDGRGLHRVAAALHRGRPVGLSALRDLCLRQHFDLLWQEPAHRHRAGVGGGRRIFQSPFPSAQNEFCRSLELLSHAMRPKCRCKVLMRVAPPGLCRAVGLLRISGETMTYFALPFIATHWHPSRSLTHSACLTGTAAVRSSDALLALPRRAARACLPTVRRREGKQGLSAPTAHSHPQLLPSLSASACSSSLTPACAARRRSPPPWTAARCWLARAAVAMLTAVSR